MNARALALLLLLPVSAAAGAERDERVGHENEHFTLSAAHQSGRLVAWRLDRFDGRVSVCVRSGPESPVCSAWSEPATPSVRGPFAINAENSTPVGTLWVWRIDSESGRLDYCSMPCCRDLPATLPDCVPSRP